VRFSGDGDWRHIGYKVARPGAIEIAAEDAPVTVGRVAGRADIVIPVATVSGAHARLEKKDGRLLVTDLDSTNGTYINERRLNPGFPIPVEPGSFVIFGDIHLAMFRARKTTATTTIPDADAEEGEEEEEVTSSDTDAPEAEVAVSAAAAEDTAS
jgi:pSer/pThr/pTyr-binding forkhead associated (FHA) protein